MKLSTQNKAGFLSMGDKLGRIMRDEVAALTREVEHDWSELVRKMTPVDEDGEHPGLLKRSWESEVNSLGTRGKEVVLSNDSGYTHFVEYGHRIVVNGKDCGWQRGQFFVKKATRRIEKSMAKRYKAMGARIQRRLGE